MPTRCFATRTIVNPGPRARIAVWLRDNQPQTLAELASLLDLPMSRVEHELGELLALEIVEPVDGPGPQRFRYAGEEAVVVGVDVGPHSRRLALCDLSGQVLLRQEDSVDNDAELLDRVRDFTGWLRQALAQADVSMSRLWAVAFAVPGTVGADGRVVDSPLVPNWSGIDLAARLAEDLGCPVLLTNDGTLSSVAEALMGHGSLMRDFVNISLGRRLCVRQVLDGRPYEGINGLAGSVAHLFGERIDLNGTVAWSSDTDGSVVLERALAGDAEARAEVEEVVDGLAEGIALMVLMTNPEGIVVGGSIGSRLEPWRDRLVTGIRARLRGVGAQMELRISLLHQETVLAGATILALEHATSARLAESVGAPLPDAWARS